MWNTELVNKEQNSSNVYLVGLMGSGKTTIGRAMAGLEAVTGGSLTVFGHEMRGFRERRFRPDRFYQ